MSAIADPISPSRDALPVCLGRENTNGLASEWSGAMASTVRRYTPGQIDRAGKALILQNPTGEQISEAMEVVDNWRVSHSGPLEIARKTLESRARLVSQSPTIGTRLKREDSIRAKLKREPSMQLSTMQDIGGCRVILRDMKEVDELIKKYAGDPNIKVVDHVAKPRVSGYRGKHLIWRFKAETEEHKCYDNMRIELQIRTELQHSWATAVEVCSTFTEQNLKSDHPQFNDERWVRFFALMGNMMAMNEGGGLVRETPSSRTKLAGELARLADALKVSEIMRRWNTATQITNSAIDTQAHQFLIELQAFDHLRCRVNVTPYAKGREQQAAEDRVRLEIESRRKVGVQVALVAVQSVETLQVAYPNYFADTNRFLKELDIALHGRIDGPFTTTTI
jgi:Region found in RelA / SpoT proteins